MRTALKEKIKYAEAFLVLLHFNWDLTPYPLSIKWRGGHGDPSGKGREVKTTIVLLFCANLSLYISNYSEEDLHL